jgi:hypothetical protein
MFIDNKYSKYYQAIVNNAKQQQRLKTNGYYESHHIIPKSLGGSNKKENLVLLTAREHFICHLLLVKMFTRKSNQYNKMLHAVILFKGSNDYQSRYMNSHLYESIKKDYSEIRRAATKGKSLSKEHRSNISQSLKGHTTSQETKDAISKKASERIRKPFSDDYKKRMSEIMKTKNRWTKK